MWGFGLKRDRVFYLPNGPNQDLRELEPLPLDEQRSLRMRLGVGDNPLALYIGHITYGSEVNLILEALPAVIKAVPGIRVVIMGSGDGVAFLQEQAHREGLTDYIVFTGWVDQLKTLVYLSAADLALYPHRDTLVNRAKSPSKIATYMAMGKPIIASAVGESVAYLDSGRAGLLVEPGDAQVFADGMISLLCNPKRAAALGNRARQRVREHYDWAGQVAIAEQAYWTAIHQKSSNG
jgi:glycosyltransferase involved in cell wall biosynthesis